MSGKANIAHLLEPAAGALYEEGFDARLCIELSQAISLRNLYLFQATKWPSDSRNRDRLIDTLVGEAASASARPQAPRSDSGANSAEDQGPDGPAECKH